MKPVFAVVVVLSTIWDFKVFTQIYLMPGGSGTNRDVLNLGTWSYLNAISQNRYGLGASIAVLLTVLLLVITVVYLRTCSGRRSCDRGLWGGPGTQPRRRRRGAVLNGVGFAAVLVFSLFPCAGDAVDGLRRPGQRRVSRPAADGLLAGELPRSCSARAGSRRSCANSLLVGAGHGRDQRAAGAAGRGRGGPVPVPFPTTVLVLVLVVQMVPLEALVIPLFIQAQLELLDSLVGLIVVYVAFSLPFAIWMLRGFVAAVPMEIEEAAYVDGASWRRMFWSVLLPAGRAGAGGDQRVLVHHGLERVHLRASRS